MLTGRLHLNRSRLGNSYAIDEGGIYTVFRQTDGNDGVGGEPVVLVVGFRLKLIRSSRIMHWIFQRVCILTTPFWSGFPGFRIKLWMVDPQTKNYLGIYEWAGKENAEHYASTLEKILHFFSTKDSVWYKIHPAKFKSYIEQRALRA